MRRFFAPSDRRSPTFISTHSSWPRSQPINIYFQLGTRRANFPKINKLQVFLILRDSTAGEQD
jgi:hypothetical protein